MTDFSQLDISDEPRGFTVDEVLEGSDLRATEGVAVLSSAEDLIREMHAAASTLIDELVDSRTSINASIKQARADHAILESAVARYDRLHMEGRSGFPEDLELDESLRQPEE